MKKWNLIINTINETLGILDNSHLSRKRSKCSHNGSSKLRPPEEADDEVMRKMVRNSTVGTEDCVLAHCDMAGIYNKEHGTAVGGQLSHSPRASGSTTCGNRKRLASTRAVSLSAGCAKAVNTTSGSTNYFQMDYVQTAVLHLKMKQTRVLVLEVITMMIGSTEFCQVDSITGRVESCDDSLEWLAAGNFSYLCDYPPKQNRRRRKAHRTISVKSDASCQTRAPCEFVPQSNDGEKVHVSPALEAKNRIQSNDGAPRGFRWSSSKPSNTINVSGLVQVKTLVGRGARDASLVDSFLGHYGSSGVVVLLNKGFCELGKAVASSCCTSRGFCEPAAGKECDLHRVVSGIKYVCEGSPGGAVPFKEGRSIKPDPWSVPMILVIQKTETGIKIRPVIYFRILNQMTRQFVYPLPLINETLDMLDEAKYFATMDCISDFWQVKVNPEDQEKTGFSSPDGQYHCLRLPFRLINALSTFAKLMNDTLASLIVFSKTEEGHIANLELLFVRLRKANLKLKPEKCNFMLITVNYLCHMISEDGIRPEKDKIADLTKKDVDFESNDGRENAFSELRIALCNKAILKYPDFPSGTAMGAVLSQKINGFEHSSYFISRQLNKAERNYSTTKREWRFYLYGRKFTAVTDHMPLRWLL
ncbi:hypothetical protein PR048_024324 [Dryococelus australis]|uniref:Reverse transcriptase/retrotransposon-derived protein RNase H-like domain-containing protein n=1 Tax=Dryococelus australis TaxID=614101 RepID=A0ABQ9GN93_9NEOP|nr:hypothetical protein PR048_024324 [Dryococelus australis]